MRTKKLSHSLLIFPFFHYFFCEPHSKSCHVCERLFYATFFFPGRAQGPFIKWNELTLIPFPNPDVLIQRERERRGKKRETLQKEPRPHKGSSSNECGKLHAACTHCISCMAGLPAQQSLKIFSSLS